MWSPVSWVKFWPSTQPQYPALLALSGCGKYVALRKTFNLCAALHDAEGHHVCRKTSELTCWERNPAKRKDDDQVKRLYSVQNTPGGLKAANSRLWVRLKMRNYYTCPKRWYNEFNFHRPAAKRTYVIFIYKTCLLELHFPFIPRG